MFCLVYGQNKLLFFEIFDCSNSSRKNKFKTPCSKNQSNKNLEEAYGYFDLNFRLQPLTFF